MKVEITGNRCVSCYKYTQYYGQTCRREFEAIDCGFCAKRQRRVRPGDRCKAYQEAGNGGVPIGAIKNKEEASQ